MSKLKELLPDFGEHHDDLIPRFEDVLTRFAEEVEREVLGGEDVVDDLDRETKKYTAFDIELMAVVKRNELRHQMKQKLATLLKKWKGESDLN